MSGGRGSGGAQPAAPPPPVKQNVSLGTGCQQCHLHPENDCTISELTVKVTTYARVEPGADPNLMGVNPDEPKFHRSPVLGEPKERVLTTDKIKRNSVTRIADRDVVALLQRYDLVIDAIAEGPSRDEPRPRGRISLNVQAKYSGTCSVHTHPVIYEVPKTECPELPPGGAFWDATSTEERKFYAPSIGLSDTVGNTTPFGFFMALLQQMAAGPKLIDVSARACGAKTWMGLSRADDVVLNCLVRVFRKDKWALKLKISSYKVVSHTKSDMQGGWVAQGNPAGTEGRKIVTTSSTTTGNTTTSSTRTQSSGFRAPDDKGVLHDVASKDVSSQSVQTRSIGSSQSLTRTTSNDPSGNRLSVQDRDIPGAKQQEFVITNDGKPPKGEGWEKVGDGYTRTIPQETPPPRVDLTLRRNDQELKLLEDLRKFIEGVAKLRDTITQFGELLKKAPQCGWSFSYSFAFLEGSVEGTIERAMTDAKVEERYYGNVEWLGTVTFQILLVSFSATASFGVKFDMGWLAAAEATLNGTFKTDIPLKAIINTNKDFEGGLYPSVTADVTGVLKASAAGVNIVEVRVSISGGITIMDAKTRKPGGLVWKKGSGFGFTGDLCTTDIVLKIIATSAAGGMQPYEHALLGPQRLMVLNHAPPVHP